MGTKYMRFYRFLLIFIPFLIFCSLVYPYFNFEPTELEVKAKCTKIYQNENYCIFNCSFISTHNCKGIIKVTHTCWASIYENKIFLKENKTKNISIELPRRNYIYWLRAGFYNTTYKYDLLEEFLPC
ncbi:MAG: hypothetical protein QXS48_04840 [Candidatus Aenigmatarchaeota archaeon]